MVVGHRLGVGEESLDLGIVPELEKIERRTVGDQLLDARTLEVEQSFGRDDVLEIERHGRGLLGRRPRGEAREDEDEKKGRSCQDGPRLSSRMRPGSGRDCEG